MKFEIKKFKDFEYNNLFIRITERDGIPPGFLIGHPLLYAQKIHWYKVHPERPIQTVIREDALVLSEPELCGYSFRSTLKVPENELWVVKEGTATDIPVDELEPGDFFKIVFEA